MEKSILDSLTMPVMVVDGNGQIQYGNPAARYFWPIQPEKLETYTLQQLLGEDSPVWVHLRNVLAEESSFTLEPYRLEPGPGKSPVSLRVQIDPILIPDQPVDLAIVVFWDQTKQEFLQSRDRENHLMDSISMMVGRLAHELQNPLSGVKGATQLLSRKLKKTGEFQEYPIIILKELERLERLVQGLLQHGGEHELNKSYFNLHELLDTVIWFQRNSGKQANFSRDYDPSLPDLFADKDRLHQVFLNLIQNAVEAGASSQSIVVRTKMVGPWQGNMALPDPGAIFFLIEVEDNGVGISAKQQKHLFTPFFTTKKTGTGLGLSISYQIIRAHNGLLQFQNNPSGGSVFSVTIPFTEPV